ncbi:MAG: site-specific DNA-methyltransferase [Pseudonocardiales bacterium]
MEWDGKVADVPRLRLPLQVVETVNASRADRSTHSFDHDPDGGWRNRLIWGDNLHVLASLADELAGQVDLIYIDPSFDSQQDCKDVESYLQMLYERLIPLRELLSERGSLFLHLAPDVSHLARILLDEIFGADNFRAEIIWGRTTAYSDTENFKKVHDSILCFAKTKRHIWNPQYRNYDPSYLVSKYRYEDPDGRIHRRSDLMASGTRRGLSGLPWRGHDPAPKGMHWKFSVERLEELEKTGRIYWPAKPGGVPQYKRYLDEMPGQHIGNVWDDINPVNAQTTELLGYDTQKPEALLERIIKSSSDTGSIVLDCFVGSGTTAAVAEKLKRRWVAIDIGRFAIHTTRKRLLDIPQCTPFVVSRLVHYERQTWQDATTAPQV